MGQELRKEKTRRTEKREDKSQEELRKEKTRAKKN